MTHSPVVLVHGIFGFNHLTLGGVNIATYFRDIRGALQADRYNVPTPPQLNPAGSIMDRAKDLKKYLVNNPEGSGKQVHLIAHSMGGWTLDI